MSKVYFMSGFVAAIAFLQACYHIFYNRVFRDLDGLVYVLSITQDAWESLMSIILPSALTDSVGLLTNEISPFPDGLPTAILMVLLSIPVGFMLYRWASIVGWKKVTVMFVTGSAIVSIIQAFVLMRLVL